MGGVSGSVSDGDAGDNNPARARVRWSQGVLGVAPAVAPVRPAPAANTSHLGAQFPGRASNLPRGSSGVAQGQSSSLRSPQPHHQLPHVAPPHKVSQTSDPLHKYPAPLRPPGCSFLTSPLPTPHSSLMSPSTPPPPAPLHRHTRPKSQPTKLSLAPCSHHNRHSQYSSLFTASHPVNQSTSIYHIYCVYRCCVVCTHV